MDGIGLSALVISVITALSHLHLRRVHTLCFSSECSATPPTTPNKSIIVTPPSLIETEKNISII